jgi:hypothetical protein
MTRDEFREKYGNPTGLSPNVSICFDGYNLILENENPPYGAIILSPSVLNALSDYIDNLERDHGSIE